MLNRSCKELLYLRKLDKGHFACYLHVVLLLALQALRCPHPQPSYERDDRPPHLLPPTCQLSKRRWPTSTMSCPADAIFRKFTDAACQCERVVMYAARLRTTFWRQPVEVYMLCKNLVPIPPCVES